MTCFLSRNRRRSQRLDERLRRVQNPQHRHHPVRRTRNNSAPSPSATPAAGPATQVHHEVHQGDWLALAADLPRACIDLLYVDPPFNTGTTHATPPKASKRRSSRAGAASDAPVAPVAASFEDAWPSTASYIAWLRQRLEATLPALRPAASVLVHCDWRTDHHVRLMLDDLLGSAGFVNHLIWSYGLGGSSPRRFARKHDDILFYTLDPEGYWFTPPRVPATSERLRGQSKKATDVLDVASLNNMAAERTGYPTQKPLALLELLIGACCPPLGTVLDPCCGSGTTLVAAASLGRHAIGFDRSPEAITLTRRRLVEASPAERRAPR